MIALEDVGLTAGKHTLDEPPVMEQLEQVARRMRSLTVPQQPKTLTEAAVAHHLDGGGRRLRALVALRAAGTLRLEDVGPSVQPYLDTIASRLAAGAS